MRPFIGTVDASTEARAGRRAHDRVDRHDHVLGISAVRATREHDRHHVIADREVGLPEPIGGQVLAELVEHAGDVHTRNVRRGELLLGLGA